MEGDTTESLRYLDQDNTYAVVQVEGCAVRGLLDLGASLRVLGKGCRELVNKLNIWRPFHAKVRTASGFTENILGRNTVPITFKNTTVNMDLFLCPTWKQELYLGVDFWKSFDVAQDVFEIEAEKG